MNVQEMIDALQKIEDKTLPLCVEDWNEMYASPAIASKPEICNGSYKYCGHPNLQGEYVCISAEESTYG